MSLALVACLLAAPSTPAQQYHHDANGDRLPYGVRARLGVPRLRTGSAIQDLAYLPGDDQLATLSGETVRLWGVRDGRQAWRAPASGSQLEVSSDGARLVVGGWKVQVFHPPDPHPAYELRDEDRILGKVALHPSGRQVAITVNERVPVGDRYHQVRSLRVWDPEEDSSYSVDAPDGDPLDLAFHPAGDRVALLTATGVASILALPGGEVVESFRLPMPEQRTAYSGAVTFADEGKLLVASTPLAGLQVWRVGDRRRLGQVPPSGGTDLAAVSVSELRGEAVAFSRGLGAWHLESGTRRLESRDERGGNGSPALAVNHSGDHVAVARGNRVFLHELDAGRRRLFPGEGRGTRQCLAFSPDGRWVVVGDLWGAQAYAVGSGEPHGRRLRGQRAWTVAFDATSERWVTANEDGSVACAWASTGGEAWRWKGEVPARAAMVSAEDDPRVLVVDADGDAWWLDGKSGAVVHHEEDVFPPGVVRAEASPDRSRLVVARTKGAPILYDVSRRRPTRLHGFDGPGKVISLAFHPDGTRLLVGCKGTTSYIFDVASGATRQALVQSDEDLRRRAAATGRSVKQLREHGVWWAAWVPPHPGESAGPLVLQRTLVGDYELRSSETGARVRPVEYTADLKGLPLAFSPDGATLAVLAGDEAYLLPWPPR